MMRRMAAGAVIVGIDEAGYGPLLGPLVVSAVAFEVPAERAEQCLWETLRESVTDRPRARDRRVAILDSKRLYQRRHGLAELERSALAAVSASHEMPTDLADLLRTVAPSVPPLLSEYPWYRETARALPMAADAGGVTLAARRLRDDAVARGVGLAGVYSEPLPEAHYNRLVTNTRNKAVVLFGLTTRLIQRVADAYPGRELHVYVDKQGGRGHYGQMLMRSFEGRRLVVVEESERVAAYELRGSAGDWRIRFTQEGESHHMAVALASIISKYLRELFMCVFNAFWRTELPGVTATAGYYQDGMRFLADVRPHLPRLGIDESRLVRAL